VAGVGEGLAKGLEELVHVAARAVDGRDAHVADAVAGQLAVGVRAGSSAHRKYRSVR
jgi:hypothetical protein